MAEIYRWVLPEGQDAVSLTVPEDCEAAEAVEFTAEGVTLREMHLERPEPNAPSTSTALSAHGWRPATCDNSW